MKLRRLRAIAWKETLHILRDARSLGLALVIPMVMLFLFGYALNLDLDRVPLLIWDQSVTPQSRDMVSCFTGSRYFRLGRFVDSYAVIERALDTGEALTALVIPRDYADGLTTGRNSVVQVFLDGSDAYTATMAKGYAESVVGGASLDLVVRDSRRSGLPPPVLPVDVRPRVWYNADMQSRNFIIPGLVGIIMMIISALLTSLTIAREWETGTMEQLVSTPVKPAELVLGKLLPYFFLGLLDVALAVSVGVFLFGVPLRGSPYLLFGLAAVFLVGALCFGLLLSVITRQQLLASQLSIMLTYLPAVMLSGFIFAIRNMPVPVQIVTYFFPARYFIGIIKAIFLKGLIWQDLWFEAVLLALFSFALVLLCIAKFRKKLV